MKGGVFVSGCLAMMLTCAAAESASDAPWIGVWQGKLEGLPGVILTLADDTGELGGSIVFNAVDSSHTRVVESEAHVLMHPHVDGASLSFQVKRTGDFLKRSVDARELQMTVTLVEGGKAQLRCLNCGSDSPVTELERAP